ncbi:MAG: DHHA1 domain-containing protein [Chloroflexi bacterium]|nr:DHHA1 domain-containing protein [Chloroflexota bacterium]MCL5075146.1 DHHA1 domain-containing protein [Chloroflexota bacterium]
MTERLYLQDAYLRAFTATIVKQTVVEERTELILDRTCFYPTSGGQPCDLGTLNDLPVLDVFEREGEVVHILPAKIEGETVYGCIDWSRRFDHMQQHSGQHILSQSFLSVLQAETVSFHLGSEDSTIDIAVASFSPQALSAVEDLANSIVFENRAIKAYIVDEGELNHLSLRKRPTKAERIRIVEVEGFDLSPCGGTHCTASGVIGLIKVTRCERKGRENRIHFLCGWRALRDYHWKNKVVNTVSEKLSTPEPVEAVTRLLEENSELRKEANLLKDRLLDYEAIQLVAEAPKAGEVRVVSRIFVGRETEEIRRLAAKVVVAGKCVALLGLGDDKAHLFFARSADLGCDMNRLLREVAPLIGGQGGGQSNLAQGGGPNVSRLSEAIGLATERLLDDLGRRE